MGGTLMRFGVLGTGTIATAVVRGFAGQGAPITVSRRNADNAAALAAAYDTVSVGENQQVIDDSDVVFLGMTGASAADILSSVDLRSDQRIVSFMADFPSDRLEALIAPARLEAVMIPFPAIASGGAPVFTCPQSPLLENLFGAQNTLIAFDDMAQMQPFMAAQAVLSPALKQLQTAADWLSARTEDPEQADSFLRALVASALQAAPLTDGIEALSTPGGLNAQLREHMQAAGMGDALSAGLNDLEQRLKDTG